MVKWKSQIDMVLPRVADNNRSSDNKKVSLAMDSIIPQTPTQCAFNFESLDNQPVEPLTYTLIEHQNIPVLKQCYACGKEFPATKQFFQSHNQKKDGLSPRCKTCIQTGRKPYQRDKIPDGKKRCSKCAEIFDATTEFFSKHSKIKSGLKPACKECMNTENKIYEACHAEERQQYRNNRREDRNANGRQYYASNKEVIAQKEKQRYQVNKEEVCEKRKAYVEANKEEVYKQNRIYREEHREELNEYNRQYAKSDQGRVIHRAANHKRKALKKAAPGILTAEEIQTKLKAQKHKCYYCQKKFEKKDSRYIFEIEHTVPLSRTEEGPRHDINYVVLACNMCNSSKRAKLPHEWFDGGRLL